MAAHDDQINIDESVQPQVQYRDYLCDPCHPVQERFTCGICYNLMEKPRLLDCCGSIYCATCLDKEFKRHRHQKCPHCRATTTFVEDKGMEREIKAFRIRCPYFMNGCKWSGELHHFMAFRKHSEICERKLVSIIKAMAEANQETHQKFIALNVPATSCFYDNHSYDFEEKIHDRYICSICCELMKDPQLMVCCGFYCCSICLDKWLLQKPLNCPFCPCSALNYVVHKYVQREIQNLKVLCTNQRRGCEWVGELRDVHNHLNKKCECNEMSCIHCNEVVIVKEYQSHESSCQELPLECPNKCGQAGITRRILCVHRSQCKFEVVSCSRKTLGCKARMKRQDIRDHLDNSCKFTPTKCEYCGKKTNMKEYSTSHIKVCVKYPVMCPNGCGESGLIRRTLDYHMGACRLELIACKYSKKGCNDIVRRQDVDDHLRTSCKLTRICIHCDKIFTKTRYVFHEERCQEIPLNCPNNCGQSGIVRRSLSKHQSLCKLEVVPCSSEEWGCEVKVKRQNLQYHLDYTCKIVLMTCEYCGEIYSKDYYNSIHINKCTKFTVACPNGCGKSVLVQQALDSHRKTCELEMIKCIHPSGSCHGMVRRLDMLDHLVMSCKTTITHFSHSDLHWNNHFMMLFAPKIRTILKKYRNLCINRNMIEHANLNSRYTTESLPEHKAITELIHLKNVIIYLSSITKDLIDKMKEHDWMSTLHFVVNISSFYKRLQEDRRNIEKKIEIVKFQNDREEQTLIVLGVFVVALIGIIFMNYMK